MESTAMSISISPGHTRRRAAAGFLALAALLVPAPVASAGDTDSDDVAPVILLDGAKGAEGIAAAGSTRFFAGDLITGDIYRGDIRRDKATRFIDAPEGRMAVGMKADRHNDLLFVAGGPTGQAYVYDTDTGKTVRTYQLTKNEAFINDVALTDRGAWFTNSRQGELYFIPVDDDGDLGSVRTLPLKGPAADTSKQFNLNGIAYSRDARRLVVAHSGNQTLYTVSPRTGNSTEITGVKVANADGVLVKGDTVWAVQNFSNQISRLRVNFHESTAKLREVITSPNFNIPTTAALFDDTLAAVNAKFGVPDATTFEVVTVDARTNATR
ncbi:SMP-30/gluconolactonase/LRE family protein [Arthrobacter sp. QXT-31]|uniref:SMP-30/gluconolactonase/LRE family protein n=1 Tax=Arthrobacter sp. QXT-31 TaxID=1357915 RepID=UPI0009FAF89F|nr:SMP-30/gluconolactonase/LRE family protein [Arthrobacter sp. QXT-31]